MFSSFLHFAFRPPLRLSACQLHLPPGGARGAGLSSVASQKQGLGQLPLRFSVQSRYGLVDVHGRNPGRDGGRPRESNPHRVRSAMLAALRTDNILAFIAPRHPTVSSLIDLLVYVVPARFLAHTIARGIVTSFLLSSTRDLTTTCRSLSVLRVLFFLLPFLSSLVLVDLFIISFAHILACMSFVVQNTVSLVHDVAETRRRDREHDVPVPQHDPGLRRPGMYVRRTG